MPMATARPRGRPAHADVLTPAEWRVVDAVRHGMSNPQIARRQGVTLDAVKYHVANALQKLGLSSRRELRHWNGIRRDSVLGARGSAAPGAADGLGAVAQIARSVADLDAARAWYAEVLGLPFLYEFPGMAFFDMGGTRLYLAAAERPAPESILYFGVADIQAAHVALTGRGVEFTSAAHRIHRWEDGSEEWLAFFKDNEGRPLGLISRVAAGAAD